MVVATKFLPRTQEEIERGISGQQHIENMIDTSLHNLGMDYVDLYIYHMWDWQTPIEDIMDGLNRIVKAGKARYIGISNCFAWQIAKANALAEKEGFAKFVSIQGHYNLIFREEEREMVPYCKEENIALTPYSALASGRLSRLPGEGGTKRAQEDTYARFKYDATAAQDNVIIARVAELAAKHGVTMTEVSLAWLLTKGYLPCGRSDQASPYRRRGKSRGPGTHTGRDRVSRRALRAPSSGRRHGAEQTCRSKRKTCLVHR